MDFKPLSHAILRIVTGLLFFQHGTQKLFGWFGADAVDSWFAFPRGIAGMLETFGGLMILVGLFTRPVAFLLCGMMAYAFFTAHVPRGDFWPIQNGGEPAVLFCFIYLFLWWNGSGPLSVDDMMKKDRDDHLV